MKRMVWMGAAIAVVVVAGCATDSADSAGQASTTATSTTIQQPGIAAEPAPPLPPATSVESEAAVTQPGATPAPLPPDPAAELELPEPGTDMPHGQQLYLETCQRFIVAVDGLAATGVSTREQSVTGLTQQLQSNASWPTLAAEDQQEILRGLDAAGRGAC